jgi:uncharacterized protein (TIGR03435 family)
MVTPRVFALALLLPVCIGGQTATPTVAFEVASVKPHEGGMPWTGVRTTGNRLETYSNIGGLVMFAYKMPGDQISVAADVEDGVRGQFYHIEAKAPGDKPPTRDEFRPMVQALLAERFKVTVHREMREKPVYALVVAKSGPKFKEAAPDANTGYNVHADGRNSEVTTARTDMAGFVDMLDGQAFLGRHIVEKTGLTGQYAIKLTFTPNDRLNAEPVPGDINILDAVQDQLGLKLEPQKAMVEMLVVDHVEKPTGN